MDLDDMVYMRVGESPSVGHLKKARKLEREERRERRNEESDCILYYGMRLIFGDPVLEETAKVIFPFAALAHSNNPNFHEFFYLFHGDYSATPVLMLNSVCAVDIGRDWGEMKPHARAILDIAEKWNQIPFPSVGNAAGGAERKSKYRVEYRPDLPIGSRVWLRGENIILHIAVGDIPEIIDVLKAAYEKYGERGVG